MVEWFDYAIRCAELIRKIHNFSNVSLSRITVLMLAETLRCGYSGILSE